MKAQLKGGVEKLSRFLEKKYNPQGGDFFNKTRRA